MSSLGTQGLLGPALTDPSVGYGAVYYLEIILLFATLAAIGPLVRSTAQARPQPPAAFGLAGIPS